MSKEKLRHEPTGFGDGKWENGASFRKYLKKRNKKNKVAKKSRKRARTK